MAFWRMLDCIENWTKDKKANGLGGKISAEESSAGADIVRGFSHMMRTEEERVDICDTVSLFLNLRPQDLVKGWGPERSVITWGEGHG